ncbi:hypothetical protein JTB14_016274 [Gonioctena quinquepunctata]|nr:hypothetical protein JTB14_016274 [Gonioctena quinquepunctata]
MKSVLIFLCVVVAAMAHLPPDQKEFLRQVHLTCQADPKTFCDENILRKLSDNKDNHQAQIHMMCMAVKDSLGDP